MSKEIISEKEVKYDRISEISGIEINDGTDYKSSSHLTQLVALLYNKMSKMSAETKAELDLYISELNKIIESESGRIKTSETRITNLEKEVFTDDNSTNNIREVLNLLCKILFNKNDYKYLVENDKTNGKIGNFEKRISSLENEEKVSFNNDFDTVDFKQTQNNESPKKTTVYTQKKVNELISAITNRIKNIYGSNAQPTDNILSASVYYKNDNGESIKNFIQDNNSNSGIIPNISDFNSLLKIQDIVYLIQKGAEIVSEQQKKIRESRENYYKCCALLGVDDIVYNINDSLLLKSNDNWSENGRDKNILFKKGGKYYQIEHNRDYGGSYYYYYWCIINKKDTCFNLKKTEFDQYNIGNDGYCEVTYYYNIYGSSKTKFISDIPQISLNFYIKKEFVNSYELDTEILNCIPNIEYFTTSNSNNHLKKFPNVKYKENGINYIISNEKEKADSIADIIYKPKQLYDIEPTYNIIPSLESITLFYKINNGINQLINSHDFRFYITIYKNNELYPFKHDINFINSFKVGNSSGNEDSINECLDILSSSDFERVNFYSFKSKILEKTYITYKVEIDGKIFKKIILINKIQL